MEAGQRERRASGENGNAVCIDGVATREAGKCLSIWGRVVDKVD